MRNLIVFTALAAIATPAAAQQSQDIDQTQTQVIDNSQTHTGSFNQEHTHTNSFNNENSVVNSHNTTAENGAFQSQSESASASNSASDSSSNSTSASSNNVAVSGDTHTYRRNTPPAIAPSMISQCGAGVSGAASGPSFGAALGIPFGLGTCQRVLVATQMAALNRMSTACEIMRQDKRVRRAMEQAGETCAYTPIVTYAPEVEAIKPEPMFFDVTPAGERG